MSIAAVVTRGYGSFGSVAFVVTNGYGVGVPVIEPPVVVVPDAGGAGDVSRRHGSPYRTSNYKRLDQLLRERERRALEAAQAATTVVEQPQQLEPAPKVALRDPETLRLGQLGQIIIAPELVAARLLGEQQEAMDRLRAKQQAIEDDDALAVLLLTTP
jgi:hypothetical protein